VKKQMACYEGNKASQRGIRQGSFPLVRLFRANVEDEPYHLSSFYLERGIVFSPVGFTLVLPGCTGKPGSKLGPA
jgi:hypothetical protein